MTVGPGMPFDQVEAIFLPRVKSWANLERHCNLVASDDYHIPTSPFIKKRSVDQERG